MYNVYCVTQDRQKMLITYQGQPAGFESDEDAWSFVEQMMSQEDHPLMMWIKEVPECKFSTT